MSGMQKNVLLDSENFFSFFFSFLISHFFVKGVKQFCYMSKAGIDIFGPTELHQL